MARRRKEGDEDPDIRTTCVSLPRDLRVLLRAVAMKRREKHGGRDSVRAGVVQASREIESALRKVAGDLAEIADRLEPKD